MSGNFEGGAFAIVSDGCSTGGRTDVGARVVSLATAQAITSTDAIVVPFGGRPDAEFISAHRQVFMGSVQGDLGLPIHDMLATCLFVVATKDRGCTISIAGDGVLATRNSDGAIAMTRFEWQNNMPLYPAYAQDGYAAFVRAHGDNLDAPALTAETWVVDREGEKFNASSSAYSLGKAIRGISLSFDPGIVGDLRSIAVFSDGVTQVDGMSWQDAVLELLSFKSEHGDFAKRRMNRFLKDVGACGRGPLDDISYAAIQIFKDPE
jgi:hypothetical protein